MSDACFVGCADARGSRRILAADHDVAARVDLGRFITGQLAHRAIERAQQRVDARIGLRRRLLLARSRR